MVMPKTVMFPSKHQKFRSLSNAITMIDICAMLHSIVLIGIFNSPAS